MLVYIIRDIRIEYSSNIIETLYYHRERDGNELSPQFKRFHDELIKKYPCLCEDENSVWGDGPLINNFGDKIACLDLYVSLDSNWAQIEEVQNHIISLATAYDFDVYFEGHTEIIRPHVATRERRNLKFTGGMYALLIGSLWLISSYLHDFGNGETVQLNGSGKGKIVSLIFIALAKQVHKITDYATFILITINLGIILLVLLLYKSNNFPSLKNLFENTKTRNRSNPGKRKSNPTKQKSGLRKKWKYKSSPSARL